MLGSGIGVNEAPWLIVPLNPGPEFVSVIGVIVPLVVSRTLNRAPFGISPVTLTSADHAPSVGFTSALNLICVI